MKCRAAVLRGVGEDWEIREVELDPPRNGEVLVRMAAAGVCHSDDHLFTGDVVPTPEVLAATGMPAPDWFPLLGGHEGAGVVAEVGPGVTTVQPGDHVALSFIPACGNCRFCVNGQSYICDIGASLFVREMPTDGTCRRHLGDENLLAYGQLGTFAEYAVLSERSVIKIDEAIPFHAASLVSCGVSTGWGSATVSAGTEPGDTVVVIGAGGVGMNALQGARAVGAKYVVAVDPVESKRDSAKIFGATHSAASAEEAVPLVREITVGLMADRVVISRRRARGFDPVGDGVAPQRRDLRTHRHHPIHRAPGADGPAGDDAVGQATQGSALWRNESAHERSDAVVDVSGRRGEARRVGHPALPARPDQRGVRGSTAKDVTSAASSISPAAKTDTASGGFEVAPDPANISMCALIPRACHRGQRPWRG